jgi:hypothetical protein
MFFISCKEFKEITVTNVDSFYMNKITTEQIEAEVNVKINNPNNTGFSIYPSEFDVMFSGVRLGKAKLNKRVHIEGKTEKVYTFKLNSKISEMNPLDALRLMNLDNFTGKLTFIPKPIEFRIRAFELLQIRSVLLELLESCLILSPNFCA